MSLRGYPGNIEIFMEARPNTINWISNLDIHSYYVVDLIEFKNLSVFLLSRLIQINTQLNYFMIYCDKYFFNTLN